MKRHTRPSSSDPIQARRNRRLTRLALGKAFRLRVEELEPRVVPANVDILSFHPDIPTITNYPNGQFLTAANLQETTLTTAAGAGQVSSTNFGLLVNQPVDGQVYAQPLYKTNVNIGGTMHNVVYVATQHDSVYAFDADTLATLWHRSFIDTGNGINTVPNGDVGSADVNPEIGITGAPVIDPNPTTDPLHPSDGASATIYFVAKTKETRSDGAHYVQRLHALNIVNGNDKFVGTTGANSVTSGYMIGDAHGGEGFGNQTSVIQVAGNGADSGGGQIKFDAFREAQRPSLELLNGRVWIAWASHGDQGAYHGWVVGFNETTLQPEKWFNTSPNARGNGIWQSEGALSTDGTYLYFACGNGFNGPNPAFDVSHGNYSESVLKLDPRPAGTAITVADYFVPNDWQSLDNTDADLGSGGVMLLPDAVGSTAHQHLMVETGKSGKIYLIDRDNLGQNVPAGQTDHVVQIVTAGPGGVWGNAAYYPETATSGLIYYHGSGSDSRVFRISGGAISPAGTVYNSGHTFGFPGAQPFISANGSNNASAIDWELQVDNYGNRGPATLYAYAARPSAQTGTLPELYNSNQTGMRDSFGFSVKFTSAVVSNGHVYVGSGNNFSIFGLFPATTQAPQAPTGLGAMGVSDTAIQLHWTNPTPGPNNAPTGIKIFRSIGDNMHYSQLTTVSRTATTFTDTNLDSTQTYFYKIAATDQTGDSPFSNEVSSTPSIAPPNLVLANASSVNVSLSFNRPAVANDHYAVERSTDNFQHFTVVATLPGTQTTYTDNNLMPGTYQYRIRAFTSPSETSFAISNVVQARIGSGSALIDYFQVGSFPLNPPDLRANGDGQFAEGTARLVHANSQTGSVFSLNKENILNWTTEFTVRLHEGTQPSYADGFAFVIQANSPTALGQGLGGLGYQGIANSIAIKFDTFQNSGETSGNSTGLYTNGANPGGPANGTTVFDLDPTQVNLQSQSNKTITLSYAYNAANPSQSVLTEEIDDPDHSSQSFVYHIDLPSVLGDVVSGNTTAYVGFTGSTGDNNFWNITDIVSWRFIPIGPAAPRDITAVANGTTAIDVSWHNGSADETGFNIFRSTSLNGTYSLVAHVGAGVTTYHDAGLAPGDYFYRVQAVNGNGSSGVSATTFEGVGLDGYAGTVAHDTGFGTNSDLRANGTATFLGAGTNPVGTFNAHQDVGTAGDPGTAGTATFNSSTGTYTLTASGSDIWDVADHMQYTYRPLTGNGEIVARVASITNPDYWTKTGLMIRSNLTAGSPDAFMLETGPGHDEPVFQWRLTQGGTTSDPGGHPGGDVGHNPPIWLRLVRSGTTFSGFWAMDLGNGMHGPWNAAGSQQIPNIGTTALVGLALTAHNNSAVGTAVFDHVTISTLSNVPLQLTDAGTGEAGSTFTTAKVPTSLFNTSFVLQDYPVVGSADSASFVLQNDSRGAAALGASGGCGGYGGATGVGIANSIAIKFDLYTHNTHKSSTGLFMNGQCPDADSSKDIDMTPFGINLANGNPVLVNITYNGVSLVERVTDTVTGNTFVHSYTINLNQVLGGNKAYAGFTGATGGESAFQDIQSWTGDFLPPGLPLYVVSGFPSSTNAGDPHSLTVTVKYPDNTTVTDYTGTVHFTSSDAQAVLPMNYTFTAADMGTHTFSGVVLKTAGTQSITATDTTVAAITGVQTGIVVNGGAASTLSVAGFPSPVLAGVPGTITVTARDPYGNVATGYTGTVTFSSTDPAASLPADYTFTAADAGVHTFGVLFETAGTQSVTATDRTTGTITGSQTGIVVNPAGITVFGFSSPATAGVPGSFTVALADAQGNPIHGTYSGTVHFTSSDPQAVLPADYTFTAADNGQHTFSATLKTAGTQAITATDAANSFTATQAGISVVAGPADHITLMAPSSVIAGQAFNATVTVQDAYNNTATGYTGTVQFVDDLGNARMYTFTSADQGQHTFGVRYFQAGTRTVTATDTSNPAITGSTSGVVNPAAASTLVVSGYPSPTVQGTINTFTVTAYDPYGNVATGYTGTITFSSSDPSANLPADYTFQPSNQGTMTFAAVFNTVGTQSLTATDTVNNTITGTQDGIVVDPATGPQSRSGGGPVIDPASANAVLASTPAPATPAAAGSSTTPTPAAVTTQPDTGTVAAAQVGSATPLVTPASAGLDSFFLDLEGNLLSSPVAG